MRKLIHGMSLAILIAVLVGASVASAGPLPPLTASFGPKPTAWKDQLSVPQFNPAQHSTCPTLDSIGNNLWAAPGQRWPGMP